MRAQSGRRVIQVKPKMLKARLGPSAERLRLLAAR